MSNGNVVSVEFKTAEGNSFVAEIFGESGNFKINGLPPDFVVETMRILAEVLPWFLNKTAAEIELQLIQQVDERRL